MRVFAHRGAKTHAPENTYAAFDLALEQGADGIETDIQATKDGKLIILHDDLVDRTTNGHGIATDMTWDEIKDLDAGSWYDPKYKDERIPLFEDFLKRYGPKTKLDLEVKNMGDELEVLSLVERENLFDQVIFTSFHFQAVINIKQKNPRATVGFLFEDFKREYLDQVVAAGINIVCPFADIVTSGFAELCHEKGLYIISWSPSSNTVIKNNFDQKVNAVIVDSPKETFESLKPYPPVQPFLSPDPAKTIDFLQSI